jgi:hypothetical protein
MNLITKLAYNALTKTIQAIAPGGVSVALPGEYLYGSWVPSDNSGAGLSFTVFDCTYIKIGKKVFIEGSITWPATASGAQIDISGLPFTAKNGDDNTGGLCIVGTNSNRTDVWLIGRNTKRIIPATITDTAVTNANYSAKKIKFFGNYTSAE